MQLISVTKIVQIMYRIIYQGYVRRKDNIVPQVNLRQINLARACNLLKKQYLVSSQFTRHVILMSS